MVFQENTAHIVYASDDHFAEILGISMISLFDNSKEMEEIIVYILDGGITLENKRRIETICKKNRRHAPIWIRTKNIQEELGIKVWTDRGSLSQYARLFISSMLPENITKVLYLDCDIIINQSIKELWNLPMQGKTIAALMDAFSKYYRANIGLKEQDIMFNSGVMLIDLILWKKKKVEDRLLKLITTYHGKIQQGDQGALNAVLARDVYCFEPRFNSVTIFYDFSYQELLIYRKPPKFYPKEQIIEAVENPVIIHFTTSFLSKRPWIKGCQHRYVEKWKKYKMESPWKEEPLWEDTTPWWKQKMVAFYKRIPKGLALHIAGLLQAYARPIKNRRNRSKDNDNTKANRRKNNDSRKEEVSKK